MVTRYGDLSEPFPPSFIDTVQKGRRSEDYVNHAVVTDRLNRLVKWTFEVREVTRYQDDAGRWHVDGVLVRLTIGDEYRDEAGGTDRASTYGEELQVAISDALKRAAMRFGVAIQLWHELPQEKSGGPTDTVNLTIVGQAAQDAAPSVGTGTTRGGSPAQDVPLTPPLGVPVSEPSESEDPTAPLPHFGEGVAGDEGSSGSGFLTKEEQKAFAKALGGQTIALHEARSRYGERIRSLGDITRDMALEMVAERVG